MSFIINCTFLLFLWCYLFAERCVLAYKPVFIIHGVLSENASMIPMAQRIQKFHPGTKVYVTDKFAGWSSLTPMWHQVDELGEDLMKIAAAHPEGVNLIGYSQGGLVARAILERFSEHNVDTFISLSSPQGGQYGANFLHLIFPGLVCHSAYELFYSDLGQHTSVGNYWNDPHHQALYREYSVFLPYVNNEIKSVNSTKFKKGITKLRKLVLIGGPDDGVITPWESSHFGYYDNEENVVDLKNQRSYVNDSFGLRTLDEKKKLVIIEQSGVTHSEWHTNTTVVDKFILPYLN